MSSSNSPTMATRGAALNPTSLPFFPGGLARSEEDHNQGGGGSDEPKLAGLGFRLPSGHFREDYMSSSTTSDYRSFSSPSPPYPPRTDSPESTQSVSKENFISSPQRHVDDNIANLLLDSRVERETSTSGDANPATDTGITAGGTPIPTHEGAALPLVEEHDPAHVDFGTLGSQPIRILRPVPQPDHPGVSDLSNPVTSLISKSASASLILASSPASSAGDSSAKAFTGFDLHGFEAQLKASPFINDILDRLVRCELSTREIRRELGDVHRKVNLLVDRSFSTNEPTFRTLDRSISGNEPTFRNPFASTPSTIPSTAQPTSGPGSYANGGASGNTPSGRSQDEIAQISQRLNTLTTSVSQLLALQNTRFQPTQGLPPNAPPGNIPEQISSPSAPPPSMPGPHALPNRPDLRPSTRTPNPPMRTWSAGSLDLPMRPPDTNIGLGRPEAFLRDKRRSVAGLMRRDSNRVRHTIFFTVG